MVCLLTSCSRRRRTHLSELPYLSFLQLHSVSSLLLKRFFCRISESTMDLVSWSLNAIDQIFSTTRQGKGEPSCPGGTHAAGYVMDSWGKWKLHCLGPLHVEDVEDAFIFGFMITGFLLIGAGGFLVYRKIKRTEAANSDSRKTSPPDVCEKVDHVMKRLEDMDRKLGAIQNLNQTQGMILDFLGRMDNNLGRIYALIRENGQ